MSVGLAPSTELGGQREEGKRRGGKGLGPAASAALAVGSDKGCCYIRGIC